MRDIAKFLLLVVVLLTSCKTIEYVPQEAVRIEYIDRVKVDSVMVKDSVYISEKSKNDTVYITEYRYKNIYKLQEVHDTIVKMDSVTITNTITVEKNLSKWQKTSIKMGHLFLFVILISITLGAFYLHKKGIFSSIISFIKHLFNK